VELKPAGTSPFELSPVSIAVPTGEDPSKEKRKGVDPRNFGMVPSLLDFTEDDFNAQNQALANYEEINRIIKQESVSTPPGFFDNIPPLSLHDNSYPVMDIPVKAALGSDPPVVNTSTKPSPKRSGNKSGQTIQDEIAELE
jgi:hypothetical protein